MRRVSAVRTGGVLTAILLMCVIVIAPAADVVVFGFHDHVADGDDGGHDASASTGLHHSSHHCDLGMNPADVTGVSKVPTPLLVAAGRVQFVSRPAVSRSFVPFTPPRS